MEAIESFKKRFEEIDELYANSKIYTEAKASFDEGLARYSFTEQEKSTAYADFMSKAFQSVLSTATEAALRIGITHEQEKSESQKRESEISVFEEQVLKVRLEADMLLAQKEMMLAQASNETLRGVELSASIKIKEQQLSSAYIANVSENEKRKVLAQSANDNAIIKRAEHLNNYLKVLSDDKNFNIIQQNLHELIKKEILNIGTTPITIETIEVQKPILPPFDTTTQTLKIKPTFRIITRSTPKAGSSMMFFCLSAGCDISKARFEWNIEGETYSAQKVTHIFKNSGRTEITCNISVEGENHIVKEILHVL